MTMNAGVIPNHTIYQFTSMFEEVLSGTEGRWTSTWDSPGPAASSQAWKLPASGRAASARSSCSAT